MRELSTKEVREGFSDTVNQVAFGSERLVLTRRGKKIAAVVPLADLEVLESGDVGTFNTETHEVARLRETEDAASAVLAEAQAATNEKRGVRQAFDQRVAEAEAELRNIGELVAAADPDDSATLRDLAQKQLDLEVKIGALKPKARAAASEEAAASIAEERPSLLLLKATAKRQIAEVRTLDAALVADARAYAARFEKQRHRLHEILLEATHTEADLGEARTGQRSESGLGLKHFQTAVGQVPLAMTGLEAAHRAVDLADALAQARGREPEPYYDPRQSGALLPPELTPESDAGDERDAE
jgi:antitoxin (DNA-binding transcriptional repressor) of toxin-antitoxin stability system